MPRTHLQALADLRNRTASLSSVSNITTRALPRVCHAQRQTCSGSSEVEPKASTSSRQLANATTLSRPGSESHASTAAAGAARCTRYPRNTTLPAIRIRSSRSWMPPAKSQDPNRCVILTKRPCNGQRYSPQCTGSKATLKAHVQCAFINPVLWLAAMLRGGGRGGARSWLAGFAVSRTSSSVLSVTTTSPSTALLALLRTSRMMLLLIKSKTSFSETSARPLSPLLRRRAAG